MPNFVSIPLFGAVFPRVLWSQWFWARSGLVPIAVTAFVLPILSVQPFNDPNAVGFQLNNLISQSARWSPGYPILASVLGLLLGTTAWSADHRGRHVYALSLPLPRWRFTLHRFTAGLTLLAVVAAVFWIAAVVAAVSASTPISVRGYPNALALRFLLAACVSYAAFFTVASGTARTAGFVLGGLALVVVAQVLARVAGMELDLIAPIVDTLSSQAGPFGVFNGRWLIIDF